MTTPLLTTTSPHPDECADGLREVTRRLHHELGVTIVHSDDVPAENVGWWDSTTNTVVIRADTTPEQQVWLLVQVWLLLVLGPSAAGRTQIEPLSPRLRLVPAPRAAT